jgi:hypothetical protein
MWVAGIGWEEHERQWQATVNDPHTAGIVARRITRKRRIVEEVETVEEIAVADGWDCPVVVADPWAS